jgi:hypothetical protein
MWILISMRVIHTPGKWHCIPSNVLCSDFKFFLKSTLGYVYLKKKGIQAVAENLKNNLKPSEILFLLAFWPKSTCATKFNLVRPSLLFFTAQVGARSLLPCFILHDLHFLGT